jgi:signal peptidase I
MSAALIGAQSMKSPIDHHQYAAWHVTSPAATEPHLIQSDGKAPIDRNSWFARVRMAIWSLLGVVILGLAGLAVFAVLSGGWTVTPILSGSMSPGLPVGGVAVAERTPIKNLADRDIILFQNPNRPSVEMVHRIINLSFDSSGRPVVKTQGDANTAADPWTVTLGGKYVYVVQFTLPLLGYPAVYTNHGVDLMVGGLILLLVAGGTVLVRQRRSLDNTAAVREPAPTRDAHQPAPTGNSELGELVRREVRSINEQSEPTPVAAAAIDRLTVGAGRPG